ncbi:MAG: outer membrane beta-barrel protein, partial [Terriglobales bacterium]
AAPPIEIAAGPLGRLQFNGTISVLGLWQGQSVAGNRAARADLGNGMVFLQKTSGPVQFYLQAGAYNVPILGVKYLSTGDTVHDFFGPVPVAYLKVPLGGNANIEAGVLPTLIGAEDTFTFQNLNVARGLLWNQENDVNRGVQINDAVGKWSGSLSWNDGYYSNRYTWIIAEMSYALSAAHAIEVVGGGNLGRTAARTLATPVQNNSRIVDVIYSYTHGPWIVQPYLQVTGVPTDPSAGVARGAATRGAAVLASYTFKDRFSLAGRAEYLRSTGSAAQGSVNLLYGAGSRAWSFTVTPGWQRQRFFARADLGVVGAARTTPGEAFGPAGASRHQARSLLEAGLLF